MNSNEPPKTETQAESFDNWLHRFEPLEQQPEVLLVHFLTHLNTQGHAIFRASMWLPTRHPELWGTQLIWSEQTGCEQFRRDHIITQTSTYMNTPGEHMHKERVPLRWKLWQGEGTEMPLLQEVQSQGGTDYLIVPFHTDHQSEQPWITFATQQAHGFSDAQVEQIIQACKPLSWKARVAMAELATRSLLDVYIGRNAAQRVMQGEFKRGSGETIDALIWFCDMRGFTTLGDQCEPEQLVALLDQYFEVMATPIERAGGEVLKFIGDAILAIFPLIDSPEEVCDRAVGAADQALKNLAQWSQGNSGSIPPIQAGVALHLGKVLYGNIGGSSRLDFTVIGAAVNEASRVEAMCKTLSPLLLTQNVAQHISRPLVPLKLHSLRGVKHKIELFTLPAYASEK